MLMRAFSPKRDFSSLDEREILALAISSEEEDGRIYAAYADRLRAEYPASAAIFDGMVAEEDEHRHRLIDLYVRKFGNHIIPIRREHVRGFIWRRPVWLMAELDLATIRAHAREMEADAARFYAEAGKRTQEAAIRKEQERADKKARADTGNEELPDRGVRRHTEKNQGDRRGDQDPQFSRGGLNRGRGGPRIAVAHHCWDKNGANRKGRGD